VRGDDMDVINLIKNVQNEVSGLTIIWDLKYSSSFLTIEKNADEYLEIALDIFGSNDLDSFEKEIFIYAIQNCTFDKFKYFLYELALKYNAGAIEEYFVKKCFFPMDWNHVVIENYKDNVIINALRKCLERSDISMNFRSTILNTLSGRSWKEYQRNSRE
jgi:hypothetical protein